MLTIEALDLLSLSTRKPITASQIFRIIKVPTMASPQAMAVPISLIQHLPGIAVHPTERQHFAGGILETVIDGVGRKNSGQYRAQRAACAMHAEGIERIVITEFVALPA